MKEKKNNSEGLKLRIFKDIFVDFQKKKYWKNSNFLNFFEISHFRFSPSCWSLAGLLTFPKCQLSNFEIRSSKIEILTLRSATFEAASSAFPVYRFNFGLSSLAKSAFFCFPVLLVPKLFNLGCVVLKPSRPGTTFPRSIRRSPRRNSRNSKERLSLLEFAAELEQLRLLREFRRRCSPVAPCFRTVSRKSLQEKRKQLFEFDTQLGVRSRSPQFSVIDWRFRSVGSSHSRPTCDQHSQLHLTFWES